MKYLLIIFVSGITAICGVSVYNEAALSLAVMPSIQSVNGQNVANLQIR